MRQQRCRDSRRFADRLIRANKRRGERLVRLHDGRSFVARPTLHALALVEDERGPITEILQRFSTGGGFCDTASILDCCTDGRVAREDVLATGLGVMSQVALDLVSTAFDVRAQKQAEKDETRNRGNADGTDDGRLPVDRMTGMAVSFWHIQPEAAWQMTVPEWWDVCAVHIESNAPKDKTRGLSSTELQELRELEAGSPQTVTLPTEGPEE